MGLRDKLKDTAADTRSGLVGSMPSQQPTTPTVDPSLAAAAQPSLEAPVGYTGARYEYATEVLTSVMGRDKLRTGDLDAALRKRGAQGWELVSCNLDADLKGHRDGHLLIFKRQLP